jgi:histidine triad (HIT) family protein
MVARKVAKAMQADLHCDGINLLQNNGEAAGQTVFHFHMHLIPRYKDDQFKIPWAPGKYADGEAEAVATAIAAKLS